MQIITGANNEVLRTKSEPVENFDSGLKKLIKKMREQMKKAKGLGLAAPQVGENIRVCVVVLNYDTPSEMIIPMVNPEILSHGEEEVLGEEGCLSLPGIYAKVERWGEISVEFCDVGGGKHILQLNGLNARVVQHEIDHLDGVLFIDRIKSKDTAGGVVM